MATRPNDEPIKQHDEDRSSRRPATSRGGVPIATPVFDGAKEADINDALERRALEVRGSRRSSTGARASSSTVR
jgi:DNA-directed RNA polymerase subunit beta